MKNFDNYTCENQLTFRDISMEIKTDEEWTENTKKEREKDLNKKYQYN